MTSKSKLVGKADPENIDWTDDLDNALLAVKKAFSAPPVLKSPNLDAIFHSGQRQRHRSRCSHASRSRQRAPSMSVCISHTDGDRDLVRASTQDTCSEMALQNTLWKLHSSDKSSTFNSPSRLEYRSSSGSERNSSSSGGMTRCVVSV